MNGRPFPTLKEAIHATATGSRIPMKALAVELDWSPTEMSKRTTFGGGGARPFPADDEHLVKLQVLTGDCSILFTMADLLGFEVQPKRERLGELVTQLAEESRRHQEKLQLALNLWGAEQKGKGRR